MSWPLAFEKTESRCDWRGPWAWLLSYKIRLHLYISESWPYLQVCLNLFTYYTSAVLVSYKEEAMILKLLLFSSLLILSSSQEDDDAGNETAECDLVSQPTSLLVDSKSDNRAITSALPRIPEIGFCPFPPYSCRLPRRLRKYPECCENSVCMYTSARRRYCWRNYLSGNDLSGTQKAR